MKAYKVVRRQGKHIFLDNRLTDGGEFVSLMRRPRFTPHKFFLYSFLLEVELTPRP
jgi:hypothetical protein